MSTSQAVLLRWLPPSEAPRGGSLTTNIIPNTHNTPSGGVTSNRRGIGH